MDSKGSSRTRVSFHFSSSRNWDFSNLDRDDESTLCTSEDEQSLTLKEADWDVILTSAESTEVVNNSEGEKEATICKEADVWGTILSFCHVFQNASGENSTVSDQVVTNASRNRDDDTATESEDDAIASLERCLHAQRCERGENDLSVVRTLHGLASELQSRERYDEAIGRLKEAMDLVSKIKEGEESEQMSDLLSSMGSICSENGMYQESIRYYKASLAALIGSGLWEDHPKVDMLTTQIEKLEIMSV